MLWSAIHAALQLLPPTRPSPATHVAQSRSAANTLNAEAGNVWQLVPFYSNNHLFSERRRDAHLVVVNLPLVGLPKVSEWLELGLAVAFLLQKLVAVLGEPPAKHAGDSYGVHHHHEGGVDLETSVARRHAHDAVVCAEIALAVVESIAHKGREDAVGYR